VSYDLLLKGGLLIDPAQKVHAARDIAFAGGRVAWVGEGLAPSQARDVMDCAGLFVVPGMIDLHVHVFWGVSHYGIEPDPYCVSRGVTTAVDAGSAGADTFPGFRKYVMEASATRLLALINISTQGLLSPDIGELDDPRYASVSRTVGMIQEHRDVILAVKVRLTKHSVASERAGLRPLQMAREAADAVGLPLMVHPQDAWCDSIDEILAVMGNGDILTHCFHGLGCGILDAKGRVRPSVRDAADRGVIFDVGHGRGSFKWDVAERAIAQGFKPHNISSDLHVYNIDGPVHDLATTVSKFIHLGLSIDEALEKVTSTPARILHMSDKLGTLKVGAQGDAVVLQEAEGRFALFDTHGQERLCKKRLIPRAVVRSGKRYIEPETRN
jgi:dihydroorotase